MVLGIESSCDETGVALLDCSDDGVLTLRGEKVISQVSLHELYGGVVPELASREHLRALPALCDALLSEVGVRISEVAAIGVTAGPGLKGCLLIGVTFAQGIQAATGANLVGINHIEGHVLSGEMHAPDLKPPYLTLVVSGGHTELVLVERVGTYSVLRRTQDDAAGEAFDKSATLLGMAYPGGPRLAALADTVSESRFTLPRVSREIKDFSFSGLKTAVMLLVQRNRTVLMEDPQAMAEAAWAVQDAILDPLVNKTESELKRTQLPLVVCGGVSANRELRRRLQAISPKVIFPALSHCVDNGAMIGFVAARYLLEGRRSPSVEIRSRWPIEAMNQYAPQRGEQTEVG